MKFSKKNGEDGNPKEEGDKKKEEGWDDMEEKQTCQEAFKE